MKWDTNTKEGIAYIFAGAAFFLGWGITLAGFIVSPTGEIHDTVLWVLGQALVFTASVLGFAMQVKNGLNSIREDLDKRIESITKRVAKVETQEHDPQPSHPPDNID